MEVLRPNDTSEKLRQLSESKSVPELSIVIPVYNEADSIEPVVKELMSKLEGRIEFELIVVDDGSNDATPDRLQALSNVCSRLRISRHPTNQGKSVALITGASIARASWIATMDGDGQNDPSDILNLYTKLCDVTESRELCLVAGRRRKRKDTWVKLISSRIANRVREYLLKDDTPDTACGLKIFSRKEFLNLPRFENMHRFLPALFKRQGGKVFSVCVEDRPRAHGRSKYGIKNRLWIGIFDLLGVFWLQHRPILPTTENVNEEDK
jgi:dolichol-phosphate mannosyltransferase